ncbi:DUF397 domain-containing protein [Dactylosporangium sp. CA-139114]|uniref:DUF397 domain-containing protein n=1 Tax=Dactylosporangium sp. CA-139114 TaxID=3239931 RepID=UPI003D95BC57
MSTLDDTWRKSTRSNNNGSCVEVRLHDDAVQVRDTKQHGSGPILTFGRDEWTAFIEDAKAGHFDLKA